MGPPALEKIKTQLDTTLGNLLCLSWIGKHQRCLSPASAILAFCDSIILHIFAGEWVKDHRKGNRKTSVVLVVTEILIFNGISVARSICVILHIIFYIHIIHVLWFCWWETRTQTLHFRAPEAFRWPTLPGFRGVKHCYVFMHLCSGNLL